MKNVTFARLARRSGKGFLVLASLSSFNVFGQAAQVTKLPSLIQGFSQLDTRAPSCEVETSDEEADCICVNESPEDLSQKNSASDSSAYGERAIFKYTDWKEVPPHLQNIVNLDRSGDISPKNPLYISLVHKNDNWPGLKGNDSIGLTGVLKLEVGGVAYNNGKPLAWGGYLYSALYSQRVVRTQKKATGEIVEREFMGDWKEFAKEVPQDEKTIPGVKDRQITKNEENTVLAFFVNNYPQKKPLMWGLEGGLGIVDSKKGLFMHPVQGVWHKSLGIVEYESAWDNNDRIYSAFLKGSVGLQKKLFDSKLCTIDVNAAGGASVDTSRRRNFFTVDVGADVGFFSSKSGDRKILGLDSSVKYQGPLSGGPQTAAVSTGVSVDMGKVKVASGVITPLVGNYTEDFKTRYSTAQKLGYIKLIYVIRRKP